MLFGILGSLVVFVLARIVVHFAPALKDTLLFRTQPVNLDLHVVGIQLRINLLIVIGFIAGMAYCLFRGTRQK